MAKSANRKRHGPLLAPWLALKDLAHEWVLTSALVLAIGAVVAPLLILLGLKFGVIEFQISRLIEDPVYREITPAKTQEITPETIEVWRDRVDVVFISPGITRGASSAVITMEGASPRRMDLVPTLEGDPLLLANGAEPPSQGELVITFAAAQKLLAAEAERNTVVNSGASADAPQQVAANTEEMRAQLIGRRAEFGVGRQVGGRKQSAVLETVIAGVLDARADGLDRIYAPFALVEAVEEYRSGFRSDLGGAADALPESYPSYDGVALVVPGPISRADRARMKVQTGVSHVREVDAPSKKLGLAASEPISDTETTVLMLRAAGSTLQRSNLAALRRATPRLRAERIAFVDPISARIVSSEQSTDVMVVGEPDADSMAALGLKALTPAEWLAETGRVPIVLGTQQLSTAQIGDAVNLTIDFSGYSLSIPAEVRGRSDAENARIPIDVAAKLRTGFERRLVFDRAGRKIRLTKEGYRGFRLYARSIDDVAGLARFFANQKIDVVTQAGTIESVKEMEKALTRLFWLVAIVGIVGAVAAMVSSLVAAVERKRVAIGMMRLLGLTRAAIFTFPVVQAVAVAILATGFAVAAFLVLADVINTTFASAFPLGERLCHLPPDHLAITFGVTTTVAAISALWAARRATRIDPAHAIRQE